jgi:K+-transporting ATPase KdpF subunit
MNAHDAGCHLYHNNNGFLRSLRLAREGLRKALNMMDMIVGLIGLLLILYLWVSILRPEKF